MSNNSMKKNTTGPSFDHGEGDEQLSNLSKNDHFGDVLDRRMSRRAALKGD